MTDNLNGDVHDGLQIASYLRNRMKQADVIMTDNLNTNVHDGLQIARYLQDRMKQADM